ncbi:MAG: DUF1786 family protein [Deltaproteobacteria bacterium]|nr:DUF1786 family protein [Deltaproteobacteria bacterium]
MSEPTASLPEWKRLLRESRDAGVTPERAASADSPAGTLGALCDLARFPEIHTRSFRRGMVLCAVGESDLTAALLWRGRIFGIYRHSVAIRGVEGVLEDLKEFRLGWLPDEAVRETGGEGTAFAELPPEAEGFPVACFTGRDAGLFAGHGKIYGEAR